MLPSEAGNSVRVLSRGLTLIKVLCPRNQPMTNGELAQATGLPRPTVSRLTATLTRLRYLVYLPDQAQYCLGEAALALGFGALSGQDIRLRARARMQRFADKEDLLVVLATRDDLAMVCHEVCRGRGALTIRVGVGSRLLLPHSAMGRAWIASLPAPAHRAVMDELKDRFPHENMRGVMDEAAAQIHSLGFCVTVSSLEPDVNSVFISFIVAKHIFITELSRFLIQPNYDLCFSDRFLTTTINEYTIGRHNVWNTITLIATNNHLLQLYIR